MSDVSLFERVLGQRYGELAPALQRFHRLAGRHELHGVVETDPPGSALGRVLAGLLGSPRRATKGPIRFELDAAPGRETWTRHFPGRTMGSQMHVVGGRVVERMGAAALTFALEADGGRLRMRLERMRLLGIPCPAWLRPRIVAEETGVGERLHFRIEAHVIVIGQVVGYRGWLSLAQATPADRRDDSHAARGDAQQGVQCAVPGLTIRR